MAVPVPIPMGIKDRVIYQTFIKLSNAINQLRNALSSDFSALLKPDSATSTGALTTSVYVKNPAQMTEEYVSGFVHNDGGIQYINEGPINVFASAVLTFSGTINDEITIKYRHWVDADQAYSDIGPEYEGKLENGTGSNRLVNLYFFAYATMKKNDIIEFWIANQTAGNAITVEAAGLFRVSER